MNEQKPAALTPMMAQYLEIKAVNPGYLLFYRMGDFYELFFEDAQIAAATLNIVLTKRGKHQGDEIPMCGVPVHAAQSYLKKLIAHGHRVAICEQTEEPSEAKKRGSKSVVRREVVRLVTAGTLTEEDLLPQSANNFLGALAKISHGEEAYGLAWTDISTGQLFVTALNDENLASEIARPELVELLVSDELFVDLHKRTDLPKDRYDILIERPDDQFSSDDALAALQSEFPSWDIASFSRPQIAALGGLISYLRETQKDTSLALTEPQPRAQAQHMIIDQTTRHSLEILRTNRGEYKGSLRHAIDRTLTPGGARLLTDHLLTPLLDETLIKARLDAVEALVNETNFRDALRTQLKATPDLTRPVTRLAMDRGGPRDMLAIAACVQSASRLAQILAAQSDLPTRLQNIANHLQNAPFGLADHIARALQEDVPLLARDGNFVAPQYDARLDECRALASDSRAVIAKMQADFAELTGIKALKIKHNNVLGYFIEVPAAHGPTLMEGEWETPFVHRQSMANAMRFSTAELLSLQSRIAEAQSEAMALELSVFTRLRDEIAAQSSHLQTCAEAIAELDVFASHALLAAENSYCRPRIDGSTAFKIENGRHPVVENMLKQDHAAFVSNHCDLGDAGDQFGRLWLMTGPNMGGKSTFLRQNALMALMAQTGSFVPASSAHIGIVDRLFSRVGASDDIGEGRSTFMVEMVETAAILNKASEKSLVILDEIGRGTATFDGLSIAWATIEALHEDNRCRALFATHFHELTSLATKLDRASNHTMKVREHGGDVIFLHEVGEGAADRSYGVQVAKLAGLPQNVVERAREVLEQLEKQPQATALGLDDLPLFTVQQPKKHKIESDELDDLIADLKPDALTPLQAIEMLYQIKAARDARNAKRN